MRPGPWLSRSASLRPGRTHGKTRSHAVRCRRRHGHSRDARPRRRGERPAHRRHRQGRTPHLEEVRHHEVPDAPVRVSGGAARPRRSARTADHPRAVPRPAHREEVPGPAAGQPRRPRRQRSHTRRIRRFRAAEGGGGPVRRHRLRSARCRREQTGRQLQVRLLRPGAPGLRAAHTSDRAGQPPARQGLRAGLRQEVRGRPAAPQHDQRRARHGPDPRGSRQQADQLLRLLVRHLPRRGLCQALPPAGATRGPGLGRRPHRRLVRGQPRAGPRLRRPPPRVPGVGRQVRQDVRARHRSRAGRGQVVRDAGSPGQRAGRREGGPLRAGGHLPPRRLLQRLLALSRRGVRGLRERQ